MTTWPQTTLLLQATGQIGITDQILGAFIQVIGGCFLMILAACVGWQFQKLSSQGERLARIEFAIDMFMQSGQFNARPVTLSHNPLTDEEYELLDHVTHPEQGRTATLGDLQEAAKVAYHELTNEQLSRGERAPYYGLLMSLDMRIAALEFDLKRAQMSHWQRFIAGLRS